MSDKRQSGHRRGLFARLRASFLTGLIVLTPIVLTLWLIWTVIGWIDSWVLPLIPAEFSPEKFIGINLRGIGVVIFLVFTTLVGWLAKGLIGRSLLRWGEGIVDRMPVVRSVYNAAKQIAETLFAQGNTAFDRAALVEYPRKGIWAIGFVASPAKGEIAARLADHGEAMSVFVATTPNPTSGFLLYVPRSDVMFLDMSVEDAAKLIISGGLVYPNPKDPSRPAQVVPTVQEAPKLQ